MEPITLERLNDIRSICTEYHRLMHDREQAYNTYHSPSFDSSYQKNNPASDPVTKALYRLQDIDEKMDRLRIKIFTFERDLWAQVDDCEIVMIIQTYYLLLYSWRATEERLYKNKRAHPREKLMKYLVRMNDPNHSQMEELTGKEDL